MYQSQFWLYPQSINIFGEIGILLNDICSVPLLLQTLCATLKAERRGFELRDFYSATGTEENW